MSKRDHLSRTRETLSQPLLLAYETLTFWVGPQGDIYSHVNTVRDQIPSGSRVTLTTNILFSRSPDVDESDQNSANEVF